MVHPTRNRRNAIPALLLAVVLVLVVSASARGADAGRFVAVESSLASARAGVAMAPLADGRALLAGGFGGGLSTEIFNPTTNTFTAGPAMPTGREGGAAAPLADGRVLVVGGGAQDTAIYNPQTNAFTAGPTLGAVRVRPIAVALPGGRVLVAGGADGTGSGSAIRNTAEIYDPGANAFNPVAATMTVARAGAAAARLADGRVLIAGGQFTPTVGTNTTSAEIFDPAGAGTFTATAGPLGVARHRAAGAPLPDGRVLIAGGQVDGSMSVASAEVFLPASGTFEALTGVGGQLTSPRHGASAATLADGRVLIATGFDGVQHLKSAELLVGAPIAVVTGDGAFAATVVGRGSAARTITVTNPATPPLEISSVTVGGDAPDDYEIVSNTCAEARLSGGASCAVSVRFAPTDLGARNATLTITDNAPSVTQQVALTGVGQSNVTPIAPAAPAATPTPTSATPTPPTVRCTLKARSRRRQLSCTATAPGRAISGLTVRITRKGKTVVSRTVLSSKLTLTARRALPKGTYTIRATVIVAGERVALTRTLKLR